MKKTIMYAVVVLLFAGLFSYSKFGNPANYVTGKILEVEEEFVLVEPICGFQDETLRVNVGEETKYDEGITKEDIQVNKTISFIHTGKVTRSIPPQVFAIRIISVEDEEI